MLAGTTGDIPDEWYDNPQFVPGTRADVKADGSFTLKAGETRTLAPVEMTKLKPPVSTLKGPITDPAGRPLKGIRVELVPTDGGVAVASIIVSRSTGRFAYRDAAPGTYTLRLTDTIRDESGRATWQKQYLGGTASQKTARVITVADGKPIRGLDAVMKSAVTTRMASKAGAISATYSFDITRLATGSKPGGRMTLSSGNRSASATVVKGKVTVRLAGLPKGRVEIRAKYSGTGVTAGFTRTYRITIG